MRTEGLAERLTEVLKYTKLSQGAFADAIEVNRSYISRLLTNRDKGISKSLAFVIEEKFGIDSNWLLTGSGSMIKTYSKSPYLNEVQRIFIGEFESLDLKQKEAALIFVRMLKRIESENKSAHEAEKMEEYSKFLEWQNEQKNKNKK